MIIIRLFAALKDMAGTGEFTVSFVGGTVSDLLEKVSSEHDAFRNAVAQGAVIISVNQELAGPDTEVRDGDEVAFMPPFSGGSIGIEPVRVQRAPFSVDEEIRRLKEKSASIGAIVTFLGTTRDLSREKEVAKLEFEHYPGMAERKLREIRERAMTDYGLIDATIIHRLGTIPVGDDIVLIAVAAMHRDEAFGACRFCIDELKRIAPIWKRETTAQGDIWVEEHP